MKLFMTEKGKVKREKCLHTVKETKKINYALYRRKLCPCF